MTDVQDPNFVSETAVVQGSLDDPQAALKAHLDIEAIQKEEAARAKQQAAAVKEAQSPVALKWKGKDGQYVSGLPARDVTAEEVALWVPHQEAFDSIIKTGLFAAGSAEVKLPTSASLEPKP